MKATEAKASVVLWQVYQHQEAKLFKHCKYYNLHLKGTAAPFIKKKDMMEPFCHAFDRIEHSLHRVRTKANIAKQRSEDKLELPQSIIKRKRRNGESSTTTTTTKHVSFLHGVHQKKDNKQHIDTNNNTATISNRCSESKYLH